VRVPREVYEQARQDARRFIVLPGHEILDTETVVASAGEYLIVVKRPGVGQAVAEATNPRW
jgi:hypothetical protein